MNDATIVSFPEQRARAGAPGSEEFRLLVQSVKDYAIFLLDPEGRVVSWNEGAERIKGYAASEIVGQDYARFFTEEDVAAGRPRQQLESARLQGRLEAEGWRVRKDGSRFWAHIVLTALFDEDGRLHGFAKVTRDGTERRRLHFLGEASAALSASLDYAATLAAVARLSVPFLADWALVHVAEGGLLRTLASAHASAEAAPQLAALGRRFPGEAGGHAGPWRVLEAGRPELIPVVDDARLRAWAPAAEDQRLLRELGTRSLVCIPLLAHGTGVGALTCARTHRGHAYDEGWVRLGQEVAHRAALAIENARTHSELEKERAWLRQVVAEMPVGVIIADAPAGRIAVSNPAAGLLTGATVGDAAGGGRRAPQDRLLARALAGEAVADEEVHLEAGGEGRVLSVSASPVRSEEGEVVSAVAILKDVTAERRAREAAAQEAAFRERFIGILGHDLRNPLAAILNSANLLLRRTLGEQERRLAARVAASADRMAHMISDVLDLSRARLGAGIPIARRPCSLGQACREVLEEIGAAYPGSDPRLEADGEGWGAWDAERMVQAISNLVANAVQHGAPGRPITVRLADGEAAVVLSVHNHGAPIPPDVLPRIFEPFRQGDARGAQRAGGLGLGLYIAREIVAAHGGTLGAASDAGGTTFTVVLPRAG